MRIRTILLIAVLFLLSPCSPVQAQQTPEALRMTSYRSNLDRVTQTETRDRVCLNGLWEIMAIEGKARYGPENEELFPRKDAPLPPVTMEDTPPEDGRWYPVRVPGFAYDWIFKRQDWADIPFSGLLWYRTRFEIPESWKNKRILVEFGVAGYEAVVYLNGECVGWHRGDATPFDLDVTSAARTGQENELLVRCWLPLVRYGRVWPQTLVQTGWFQNPRGIWRDVFLKAEPAVAVRDAFCRPSYREKRLDVDIEVVNRSESHREFTIESAVLELTGKPVHKLGHTAVRLASGELATITLGTPWAGAELWSPKNPHLYLVETRLTSGDKILDVHRQRFGFRECWIEGKRIYLNGIPIHMHQQSIYSADEYFEDTQQIPGFLKRLKNSGINTVRDFGMGSPRLYEIADEVGMLMKSQSGWHHNTNALTEEFKKNASVVIEEWVRTYRNYPSLVMWCACNEPDFHYESIVWAQERIAALDPTRPIDQEGAFWSSIYDSDGNVLRGADFSGAATPRERFQIINSHYARSHCSTLYAAEYPARWSQIGKRPLIFGEWGFFSAGDMLRVVGPRAFRETLRAEKRKFWYWQRRDKDDDYFDVYLMYLEQIVPHWLRYGVSGHNEWAAQGVQTGNWRPCILDGEGRAIFPPTDDIPVEWDSLNTPGPKYYHLRYYKGYLGSNPGWYPELPEYHTSEIHERYERLFRPLLAFFPDRSRAEYGGTLFSRDLCVVNYLDREFTGEAEIVLCIEGRTSEAAVVDVSLKPGEVRDHPVQIRLPEVSERTYAKIQTRLLLPHPDEVHTIDLELDLFPPFEKDRPTAKVALYDADGSTARAFEKLGVAFERLDDLAQIPEETETIVIGRDSADENVNEAAPRLYQSVADGKTLVVLKQELPFLPPGIASMLDDSFQPCESYPVVSGHPVLAGLRAQDFTWWPNNRNDSLRIPGRIAGSVLRKPVNGCQRTLLECGENLELTPLFETYFGEGAFRVGQLDIVPIVGISPVADALLLNLLEPGARFQERSVGYLGDEKIAAVLRGQIELSMKDLSRAPAEDWRGVGLVVIAAATEEQMSLFAERIRGSIGGDGVNLLVLAEGPEYIGGLPESPRLVPADRKENARLNSPRGGPHFALWKGKLELTDGLSDADFWFPEEPIADYVVAQENGWEPLSEPAVVAMRTSEWGSVEVVCTLRLLDRETPWPSNLAHGINGLLVNLGARTGSTSVQRLLSQEFFCVDLSPWANMGFRDEVERDAKGGWTDQGINDLREFPVGSQRFLGIPFEIVDPEHNMERSCVVLGSSKRLSNLPREVKGITFGPREVRRIHFLHALAYGGEPGDEVGRYRINYTEISERHAETVLNKTQNIGEWWTPKDLPQARVAWKGENPVAGTIGVYLYTWENPTPEVPVVSVDFESLDTGVILGLIGITAE